MSDTWKKLGIKSSISIYPVQNTLRLDNIELTSDELDNKGIKFMDYIFSADWDDVNI